MLRAMKYQYQEIIAEYCKSGNIRVMKTIHMTIFTWKIFIETTSYHININGAHVFL